jgi:hypothetical protein
MKNQSPHRTEGGSGYDRTYSPQTPGPGQSNPLSPSTAQRLRNVRSSSGISPRSEAVGALLSAETVQNMRGILDQIGGTNSRSVYDSLDTDAGERDSSRGAIAGAGGIRGIAEMSQKGIYGTTPQRDGYQERDRSGQSAQGLGSMSVSRDYDSASERRQDWPVGSEGEYQRRLAAAEREMAMLSASLEAERRNNENLTAQLVTVMDIDADYPLADYRAEEGAMGVTPGVWAGTLSEAQEQADSPGPSGPGSTPQAPSNTAHRTYSSFMRETSQEIILPDGEGAYIRVSYALCMCCAAVYSEFYHLDLERKRFTIVSGFHSIYCTYCCSLLLHLRNPPYLPPPLSSSTLTLYTHPSFLSVSKDKVKLLVRRMNDLRKQARTHISRLRQIYLAAQGDNITHLTYTVYALPTHYILYR